MPLDFTAIDFETANRSSASACAVGLVRVRAGRIVRRTSWLIKPPAGHDEFLAVNIGIHGIRPADVEGAPGWAEQLPMLCDTVGTDVLFAHNAGFDMSVLRRACEASAQRVPSSRYACSVQLARATYRLPSYRLPLAAAAAGFTGFSHHDPEADAEACARIVIDAASRFGAADIDELAARSGISIKRLQPERQALPAVA